MSWLALFVYSALAATLLPGGSEILLVGLLIEQPEHAFWLWLIATLGNSLGAYVTFFMGFLIALQLRRTPFIKQDPIKLGLGQKISQLFSKAFALSASRVSQLNKQGAWLLLLSWLPIIGDGFCLAAGYLGWSKRLCLSLIFIGKALRYGALCLWLA